MRFGPLILFAGMLVLGTTPVQAQDPIFTRMTYDLIRYCDVEAWQFALRHNGEMPKISVDFSPSLAPDKQECITRTLVAYRYEVAGQPPLKPQ